MAALFLLLLFICPNALLADPVNENDVAPTLLAAIKDVTGKNPVFPLAPDHEFFQVAELDISGKSVASLKGIQFFTELTQLTADYNKIATLKGIVFPENIRSLSLAHNSIVELTDAVWPVRLRTLDLRNNRLTNPLDAAFPEGIGSIALDNNFLTSRAIDAPRDCTITFAGNFIYQANTIRPASLVVTTVRSINLSPGEQQAIPFVRVTSSTNPNNQVPPKLISAHLAGGADSPVQLRREDYRFLISAESAGSDTLEIRLDLTSYQIAQYERMSQTFYKAAIPITVWQTAENRPGASSTANGDSAVLAALSGHSSNAVADMSRYPDGRATFSPGLLAQLANQGQKLILSHDFGNIALDPKTLRSIADQASISSDATVLITLVTHEFRPTGISPSRFTDKQISILPYRDFSFTVQLQIPREEPVDIELDAPVTAVLYLLNQRFTPWDFEHLVAFKDNGDMLDILGGTYNPAGISFTYQLSGAGRFGLGTRGAEVHWIDLAINSTTEVHWDGSTSVINPAPLIYRGVTMIPLRSIFEEMGATVTWHENIRSATISLGSKTIYITEDRPISGSEHMPYMINGRMLVPLRFISTEFGATVIWWSQEGRIRIVF
ncbi:MAG: stalk domain-containing protein [Clostridiales bacterium]|nr:stalk domain-containing protein [Clostridiales bacterium]